ncbi:DinB family protein [bacterium]|nr:DinB family protein [bacterium]
MTDQRTIAASLAEQYAKVCDTVRSVIQTYPPAEWTRRKKGCLPVQQVYHTIGGLQMYCGPGEFRWDERFLGADGRFSWRTDPANPPSQSEMLDYLDRIQRHTDRWLASLSDAQILEQHEPTGRHTGRCLLDRLVYLLRHTQHHLGMIESDLIRRGLKLPEWK